MHFKDIPQFPKARYSINVDLTSVQRTLDHWDERDTGSPLILNPEWQRGHVWTKKQKVAYIEYLLMGGTTGRDIYFNCSSWMGGFNTPVYCVDGLQRITAALDFTNNKIKAFGFFLKEFEGSPRITDSGFLFHMLNVRKKRDLLKVYIDFNSGGTPHKPREIERIKAMMAETPEEDVL